MATSVQTGRSSNTVGVVEYEQTNNVLLHALPSMGILGSTNFDVDALLLPLQVCLDELKITEKTVQMDFALSHCIQYTDTVTSGGGIAFRTANGKVGCFSDDGDSIEFDGRDIQILRRWDEHFFPSLQLSILLVSETMVKEPTPLGTPTKGTSSGGYGAGLSYKHFQNRMQSEDSRLLVKMIKAFVNDVQNGNVQPTSDRVQKFVHTMYTELRKHRSWKTASTAELDNAHEGLEKYIMTKLYPKCFAPTEKDKQTDQYLHDRLNALRTVVTHASVGACDLATTAPQHWAQALAVLNKINDYRAPRDKVACMVSCCTSICAAMKASNTSAQSADDFLPCVIYAVMCANPPYLHSNLEYVNDFRCADKLESEDGYFVTSVTSACMFWLRASPQDIHLSDAEYGKALENVATPSLLKDVVFEAPIQPTIPSPTRDGASAETKRAASFDLDDLLFGAATDAKVAVVAADTEPVVSTPPPPHPLEEESLSRASTPSSVPFPTPAPAAVRSPETSPAASPTPATDSSPQKATPQHSDPSPSAQQQRCPSQLASALCSASPPRDLVTLDNVRDVSELRVGSLPALLREYHRLRGMEQQVRQHFRLDNAPHGTAPQ